MDFLSKIQEIIAPSIVRIWLKMPKYLEEDYFKQAHEQYQKLIKTLTEEPTQEWEPTVYTQVIFLLIIQVLVLIQPPKSPNTGGL